MDLHEFQFEIKHKNGTLHSNANALSRLRWSNDDIISQLEPASVEDKDADRLAVDPEMTSAITIETILNNYFQSYWLPDQ